MGQGQKFSMRVSLSPQRTVTPCRLGVLQFSSVLTLAQRESLTPQIRARSHRTAPAADSSHRSMWSTVLLITQLWAVGSHNPLLGSDEFTSVVHRAQENILLTSITCWDVTQEPLDRRETQTQVWGGTGPSTPPWCPLSTPPMLTDREALWTLKPETLRFPRGFITSAWLMTSLATGD